MVTFGMPFNSANCIKTNSGSVILNKHWTDVLNVAVDKASLVSFGPDAQFIAAASTNGKIHILGKNE